MPEVAHQLVATTGDDLLAVQTVLDRRSWEELRQGFAERGLRLFAVVLDADDDALRDRIAADAVERGAERWRLDHLPAYAAARPWLRAEADLVVDTTGRTPQDVADAVHAGLIARP